MDRESFIKDTGRWTILAVLAGMVFFMVRNRTVAHKYSCTENEFCRDCSKFGSCNQPQAKEQS